MRYRQKQHTYRSSCTRFIDCFAVWLLAALSIHPALARAQFNQSPGSVVDPRSNTSKPPPPPVWRWRQVAASLRTQGRFTMVEVDPSNPRLIMVGTEEGTVLRSEDGGVTWNEIEPAPQSIQRFTLAPKQPGLPALGELVPPEYQLFIDPPNSFYPERLFIPFETLFLDIKPSFVKGGFMPKVTLPPRGFLGEATAQRSRELNSVWAIAYCPGAPYNVIVTSQNEIYGSSDSGMTYVRIFAIPRIATDWARCNPNNPLEVAVSSHFGVFLSRDGGLTFDQDLTGWPGRAAWAVEWGITENRKLAKLYTSTGDSIFAGNPWSDEGLRFIYPDFNNSETAPWADIYDIKTTKSGQVWIGTEDGLRVSYDGGKNWAATARTLFSRGRVRKLFVGWSEQGEERVVAIWGANRPRISGSNYQSQVQGPLSDVIINPHPPRDWAYSTDDGGQTWHPFFNDLTRRTIRHATASPPINGQAPQWWIATRGELWATDYVIDRRGSAVDRTASEWAKAKLAMTPPLDVVLRAMVDALYISNVEMHHFFARARDVRPYVPRLDVNFSFLQKNKDYFEQQVITSPYLLSSNSQLREWQFLVELKFLMPQGGLFIAEESGKERLALYDLNKQIRFIAEDTWHERQVLLKRIAEGMTDELAIEVLRARIEALEAVLETWTRQPLRNLIHYNPWALDE
ncbi:MAG: hypothetical protein IPJ88_05780 [Myxococcales bacterium]|nr:MAG: hypothetical protein IPJ88_05780 [Myxococcales bacterium]